MSDFNNLNDICDFFDLDASKTTGHKLIDAIVEFAHNDEIYHREDSFLGMSVSDELGVKTIDEVDSFVNCSDDDIPEAKLDEFYKLRDEVDELLSEVNRMKNFWESPLSEDEQEDLDMEKEGWRSYARRIQDND